MTCNTCNTCNWTPTRMALFVLWRRRLRETRPQKTAAVLDWHPLLVGRVRAGELCGGGSVGAGSPARYHIAWIN